MKFLLTFLCLFPALSTMRLVASTPQFPVPVTINPDQSITYNPTPAGDRIPDFSTVGYNYGNTPLPGEPGGYDVPVLVTLFPGVDDQTGRIQAAIDSISAKPPQINQHPLSQTVNQGTATSFTVAATGIGNTYQWSKAPTRVSVLRDGAEILSSPR